MYVYYYLSLISIISGGFNDVFSPCASTKSSTTDLLYNPINLDLFVIYVNRKSATSFSNEIECFNNFSALKMSGCLQDQGIQLIARKELVLHYFFR